MHEAAVVERLNAFSATEYVVACHEFGRANIPADVKQAATDLHQFAAAVLPYRIRLARNTSRAIEVAHDVLFSDYFMTMHPKPRYIAYSNLKVLDRYILHGEQIPAGKKWDRCRHAIALLLLDWFLFESKAVAQYSNRHYSRIGFEDEGKDDRTLHIDERLRGLAALRSFSAENQLQLGRDIEDLDTNASPTTWHFFANSDDEMLRHLTALPRSLWHDEYMFLRTIHVTECCFSGILTSLEVAAQSVGRSNFAAAAGAIKSGLFFSDFLVKLFQVFGTMPVAHFFNGFREATGDASAIQSTKFQTLERLTRGMNAEKATALARQRETGYLAGWTPPNDITLSGMVATARMTKDSAAAVDFLTVAEQLDRDLYQWRSKHFGVALKYLPEDARGTGDEGIPYLRANYRAPLVFQRTKSRVGTIMDAHEESEIPFEISAAFKIKAEGAPVALVVGKGVAADRLKATVTDIAAALQNQMRDGSAAIQENMAVYEQLFKTKRQRFPLTRQFKKTLEEGLRSDPLPAALLLAAELATGILMGLHDVTKISGTPRFDTASAGESFSNLQDHNVRCAEDEWVLRDQKGIFGSYFQGPDRRTSVPVGVPRYDELGFFILGCPGLSPESFDAAVKRAQELMALVADQVSVWKRIAV